MFRNLLFAFAILGLCVASAKKGPKSYDVNIPETAQLGHTTLQPGDYHLKIEGANAVLSADSLKQPVEAPVVIHNNNRKYDETAVVFSKASGGGEKITEIMLHGTTMKLDFPN